MNEAASCRINKLEVTGDTLTSRGGLAFFVKYVEAVGIVGLLLTKFDGIKKSAKGVSVKNLFLQTLCFFFDGTSSHLNYFDQLKEDTGYTAVIEVPTREVASSHAMKRFFGAFGIFMAGAFRWVLKELFVWRLKMAAVRVVELTLDTMVMDNDEALKREGCDPTYKKVKGFQPLHLIWEGKIVDAIFRRGKRHSNYGNDVEKMIRGIVTLIRTRYDAHSVTNWASASLQPESCTKRSRRRWRPFQKRTGRNTTMGGRCGAMRLLRINVTSGTKATGLSTRGRNTKRVSDCWTLPGRTTSF